MKPIFKKSRDRDYFMRGAAAGAVLMSGILIITDTYAGMSNSRLPSIADDTSMTAAEESVEVLRQAMDLSDTMMNRRIEKADIPLIVTGALRSLDPYSGFVEKEWTDRITGDSDILSKQYMIGVLGDTRPEGYVVKSTIPLSPADGVGLRSGDILAGIDGKDVSNLSGEDALRALKQATQESSGAELLLTFQRGEEAISVAISPEHLPETYAYDLGFEDGILHLRITSFMNGVSDDVALLIRRYYKTGDLKGVIFDLRGNSGGLTVETRQIAELVMPAGTLLYTEEGLHIPQNQVATEVDPAFPELALSAIVDSGSASASEIFASTIQANELGEVIGEITYGKGTIQNVYPFTDGSGALKITVGEYKDAKGRAINEIGVIPDVLVEGLDEEDTNDVAISTAMQRMKNEISSQHSSGGR